MLDSTGVRIEVRGAVKRIATPGWTADSTKISTIRRLRKMAADIHHHDLERDLFILERRAERGEVWLADWKRPWKTFFHTLWVYLYGWSSDFGRSVIRPLFWFFFSLFGFYVLYAKMARRDISPPDAWLDWDIFGFTLAQAFPYLPALRLTSEKVAPLFEDDLGVVQAMAVPHGLPSALLVFLALLALRNFFKVRVSLRLRGAALGPIPGPPG